MSFLGPLARAPLVRASAKHWGNGIIWLLYTVVGSLMPVWLGLIVLTAWPGTVTWARFLDHGEFALYSTALLTTGLLILFDDYKDGFYGRRIMGLVTIVPLLVATGVFAVAVVAESVPGVSDDLDRSWIRLATVALYAFTVMWSFVLIVSREVLVTEPSLDEIDKTGELERKFEDLGS